MTAALAKLLPTSAPRIRLGLALAAGALAGVIGFLAFEPRTLESLIRSGGYYYIAAVFALFCHYAIRVARARRAVWTAWLRRPGAVGCALLVAAVFVLWSDAFKHKILFDEYVLQGTAFQMHATKEYGTLVRAYEIAGSWVPIDSFTDKRPYFFTFLVSLLHDLTGYRVQNIFIVNAALVPVLLALVYWLARTLGGRGPALLAVGLLATLPLLGQNATGAGMELHNLTMVALVAALAVLYLRAPDEDRAAALVLGTVLLAQSRYESVIFVFPAAAILVLGWLRAGRLLLPWAVIVAPLLLIPYAWHNRVLSATPLLWQLQAGQTSRFGTEYLAGNLTGAWSFFFSYSGRLANSWFLSAIGGAAVVWLIGRAWRWARTEPRPELPPGTVALAAFGAGIAANFGLLMFYYWSRLDDVIASRFALPACLLLALLAAAMVGRLGRRAIGWATLGLLVWLLVGALPAMARRLYTEENLVMQEVEWEYAVLTARPARVLLVSNKSTIPFLLWRIPSVLNTVGRQRGAQIRYHLAEGTFGEVIVAQTLRPTSVRGEMGVDPNDLMPPEFHLETIAEKRFGTRWARLSRVVSIEPGPAAAGGEPAKLTIAPSPGPAAAR